MKNFQTISLRQKNITDFSDVRNKLLKSAKSEWVLFLDADEKISKDLKKEIAELNPQNFSGFFIKRKIIFLGRAIGEDKVLRLAKRYAGKWHRKVHETWKVKGEVGTLDNYIIHNTASNLHEYIGKINKYAKMHAMENNREGKKPTIFKIVLFPVFKFFQNIILGRGFVFSMLQSFHSFLSWSQEWILLKK